MTNIVAKMRSISDLCAIAGCSTAQIKEAEDALGITFPEEYIEYVKEFGCIDFGATEWTGLNIKGRLNTVNATEKEMMVNQSFPKGFFVLENLGIDGKIIVVNEKGEVYLLQYETMTRLCNSMADYLDICIKRNSL